MLRASGPLQMPFLTFLVQNKNVVCNYALGSMALGLEQPLKMVDGSLANLVAIIGLLAQTLTMNDYRNHYRLYIRPGIRE